MTRGRTNPGIEAQPGTPPSEPPVDQAPDADPAAEALRTRALTLSVSSIADAIGRTDGFDREDVRISIDEDGTQTIVAGYRIPYTGDSVQLVIGIDVAA